MSYDIENCYYKFEFKCPLQWDNLKKTDDSNIRFCNDCSKLVYKCKNKKEFDTHSKLGRCVALKIKDIPTTTGIPFIKE